MTVQGTEGHGAAARLPGPLWQWGQPFTKTPMNSRRIVGVSRACGPLGAPPPQDWGPGPAAHARWAPAAVEVGGQKLDVFVGGTWRGHSAVAAVSAVAAGVKSSAGFFEL